MSVHEELITALKFDEKFKNALRDYYSYGFKTLKDYKDKSSRITAGMNWDRLNNILADHEYMEWAEDSKHILFVSADSQAMEDNPFHSVYRFCDNKHTDFFLSVIAALSGNFHTSFVNKSLFSRLMRVGLKGVPALTINQEVSLDLAVQDAVSPTEILKELDRLKDQNGLPKERYDLLRSALETGTSTYGIKTSELNESLGITRGDFLGSDLNKTLNGRMQDMVSLGIVKCRQKVSEKGNKGDRYFSLSGSTLQELLDNGLKTDPGFAAHFQTALDFYSRYYMFGETGTFILDRMDQKNPTPFHFKHEYFMCSLNDFNCLDLLSAIEEKKWCRILWRRDSNDKLKETLAYPLQIRVSCMTGRETLFYYDPLLRSVTALRLEFIDDIYCYNDRKVRDKLEMIFGFVPGMIDDDIDKAGELCGYSWGTALSPEREENLLIDQQLKTVKLALSVNPQSEPYVRQRLMRECRTGEASVSEDGRTLYFETQVLDPKEMRPWIRSFYSRIIYCKGMDDEDFSLKGDVEEMSKGFNESLHFKEKENDQDSLGPVRDNNSVKKSWTDICAVFGPGEKARAHEQIFNEIFSVYDHIAAEVFMRLASKDDGETFTEEDIEKETQKALSKHELKAGKKTGTDLSENIKGIILSPGLSVEDKKASKTAGKRCFKMRFHCSKGCDFYRDMLPLSRFELRWLKTILNDEMTGFFLSEDEIRSMRAFLDLNDEDAEELPMENIVFFDRFHFLSRSCEKDNLEVLIKAIAEEQRVELRYRTNRGKIISGEFKPAVIEYSKRNARFQAYLISCRNEMIFTVNVSQIEEITLSPETFDRKEAERALEKLREKNQRCVEIEFYNTRKLADRILTQFSPWKKRCSYDKKTELYRLTLYYQKQDEKEVVNRLMGFGAYIRITDRDHEIYKEIKDHLLKQKKLIREREQQAEEVEY